MRDRNRPLTLLLLVATLTFAAGCQSVGTGPGGGADEAPAPPEAGAKYLNGRLVLTEIRVPAAGGAGQTTVMKLKNESPDILEDVVASVTIYHPSATVRSAATGTQMQVSFETEGAVDVFEIGGDGEHAIEVPVEIASEVVGLKLDISRGTENVPVTIAKVGRQPGTRLLGGLLECVAIDDRRLTAKPRIVFTVRNISPDPVQYIEYQFVLRPTRRDVVGATKTEWASDERPIPPGGTIDLSPDVSGIPLASGGYILLIRQAKLF